LLFERAPQLIPARSEIEQFFAQSSLRFFGAAKPATMAPSRETSSKESLGAPASSGSYGAGGLSPRALCAELRQIEKRHER
jgi:hypothetical protein